MAQSPALRARTRNVSQLHSLPLRCGLLARRCHFPAEMSIVVPFESRVRWIIRSVVNVRLAGTYENAVRRVDDL